MAIAAHGDSKYLTSDQLGEMDAQSLRVELRRFHSGQQFDITPQCTEVAIMLAGRSKVERTGDGLRQQGIARAGTLWLCPAGVHESGIVITGEILECLHIYIPSTLIDHSALADYDLDPAKMHLGYAGGFVDPDVLQLATSFRTMLDRDLQPTDRLFLDGMQTALAAHLLGHYTHDRWQPRTKAAPTMEPRRLKRVLDFIEARLADEISLDDLAAEACLSPYHFSRLFREATGMPPHRYVMDRRIETAKEKLKLSRSSLVDLALDCGFGSQANFTRVFRKATGLTPGHFREIEELKARR